MIHTITVLAGAADYAEAAQQHAVRMAQWFQARLRVVTTGETGGRQDATTSTQSMESFGDDEVAKVSSRAQDAHIAVESSIRREGLLKGMLAEARGSDLLVVGLPPSDADGAEPVLQAVRNAELPLLTKAECMVLAVSQTPRPVRQILVDYQGGIAGKAALRAAGEVAARAHAAVTVLCVDGDPSSAEDLSATAERYLAAFALTSVTTITRAGQTGSATEVARAAKSTEADLVVIGGERHGLMNWLRDRTGPDPEDVALLTQIPVLIAR